MLKPLRMSARHHARSNASLPIPETCAARSLNSTGQASLWGPRLLVDELRLNHAQDLGLAALV